MPVASVSANRVDAPGVSASGDGATTLAASVTQDAARAPGVTATINGASAPGVTATADGAGAPAATASGDGASAAGTSASPSSTTAPGVPDTWTWVWNWTGACLGAPSGAPRAGWTWVWNWSCADDAEPVTGSPSAPGAPGIDGAPFPVIDTPAAAAADPTTVALAPSAPLASPRSASSSTGGTQAGPPPPVSQPAVGAVAAAELFFSPATPRGATHLAPRVRIASPAARANPVRERGRRGGAGDDGPQRPFGPDPTVPLIAGSVASGGGTGFFVLLTMALLAAVSLLDPAGLSWRVATATRSGRDRIVRRIDRPG
jgi:hypothetical protein